SEDGDFAEKLEEVLHALRLSNADLLWVNPQIVVGEYSAKSDVTLKLLEKERQRVDNEFAALRKKIAKSGISEAERSVLKKLLKFELRKSQIVQLLKLKKKARSTSIQKKSVEATKKQSSQKHQAAAK